MHKAHIGVDAEPPLLDVAECIPVEEMKQKFTTSSTASSNSKKHPVVCEKGLLLLLFFIIKVIRILGVYLTGATCSRCAAFNVPILYVHTVSKDNLIQFSLFMLKEVTYHVYDFM